MSKWLIIGGIIIVLVVLLIVLISLSYVKAPPDTAYIISGSRKEPKILLGKAGFKIPFFERKDELKVSLIQIDVKTKDAVPTADYINIHVDSNVNVKVITKQDNGTLDINNISLAAQNFLNKDTGYIADIARNVLEGNIREIIGMMKLEEMVSDRQKFSHLVMDDAAPDLKAMGLEIVSFNVQTFSDDNGVIDNLGIDNVVRIQKNAAISRAESERDIQVAKARAAKEANDAQVESDREIAVQKNQLAIKQAELKKESDIKKAEADAAYKIQQEEQRKTIEATTAEANIVKQQKEVLIKQQEVEITAQKLDAEVKKKSEAEKFASQQKADAELYQRQRIAEAEKYEEQQQAEAQKAKAEADKYVKEQEALGIKAKYEAEAEGIRAKGLAEAEAIKAKALAEAEGIEKKAIAMQKMNEAAVLEMYFKALPEVVKNATEPLSRVDKITMYGDGNSVKLTKDVMQTINQVTDGLKESTGVDLNAVLSGFLGAKVGNQSDGKTFPVTVDSNNQND
ncbi:MAG: flotillin family protein [Oscillospiraceae bacterium]